MGTRYNIDPRNNTDGDHPHACGDKALPSPSVSMMWGSSPRVWGQEHRIFAHAFHNRIIPTRVGTSTSYSDFCYTAGDHPHACGDKTSLPAIWVKVAGSSPRVWGQGCVCSCVGFFHGIIPTRVGTRRAEVARFLKSEDHPHACGDKLGVVGVKSPTMGSSPRVWGQAALVKIGTEDVGIIPTRVGTRPASLTGFVG